MHEPFNFHPTQVVPAFWRYFSTSTKNKEEQVEVNGFQQFCKAVSHLYSAAMSFNPGLEELTRLRSRAGTSRNLYGEADIPGLFRLHLAGSLHAQLPTTWQHLVSAFYGRAFAVFYHRVEAGGEVGLEDSADWTGDLICRGCDQQTDTCCCKQVRLLKYVCSESILVFSQVTSSFHTAMERLGQLGLVERLSGDTVVETVEERIKEQVEEFSWIGRCSLLTLGSNKQGVI